MRKLSVLGTFLFGNIAILLTVLLVLTYYSASQKKIQASETTTTEIESVAVNPISYSFTSDTLPQIKQTIFASDSRTALVDNFLKKYGSPMKGLGQNFIDAADKYKLPFALLPAIGSCEGNLGKVVPEDSHNTWGYGVYGGKIKKFDSWEEAIDRVAKGLRDDYFNRGLDTTDKIMKKYTPNSPGSWADCVDQYIAELR